MRQDTQLVHAGRDPGRNFGVTSAEATVAALVKGRRLFKIEAGEPRR